MRNNNRIIDLCRDSNAYVLNVFPEFEFFPINMNYSLDLKPTIRRSKIYNFKTIKINFLLALWLFFGSVNIYEIFLAFP